MTRDTIIITLAGLLAGKRTVHDIYHWALQTFPNVAPPKLDVQILLTQLSEDGFIGEMEPGHYALSASWYQDASISIDLSAGNNQ